MRINYAMRIFNYKSTVYLLVIFILTIAVFILYGNKHNNPYGRTEVYYNQDTRLDQEVINLVNHSGHYAYFAVYTITKESIVDALIAAKLRGLDVKGITDYNQSIISQEKPLIKKLKKYGINLEIPFKVQGLMHMKLLVTDKGYASGSFNWSNSATYTNDEILEIGYEKSIHDKYLQIFKEIYKKYAKA